MFHLLLGLFCLVRTCHIVSVVYSCSAVVIITTANLLALYLFFSLFTFVVAQWADVINPRRSTQTRRLWRGYALANLVFLGAVTFVGYRSFRGDGNDKHDDADRAILASVRAASSLAISLGLVIFGHRVRVLANELDPPTRTRVKAALVTLTAVMTVCIVSFLVELGVDVYTLGDSSVADCALDLTSPLCSIASMWVPELLPCACMLYLQWDIDIVAVTQSDENGAVVRKARLSKRYFQRTRISDGLLSEESSPLLRVDSRRLTITPSTRMTYSKSWYHPGSGDGAAAAEEGRATGGAAREAPRGIAITSDAIGKAGAGTVDTGEPGDAVAPPLSQDAAYMPLRIDLAGGEAIADQDEDVLQTCIEASVYKLALPLSHTSCFVTMDQRESVGIRSAPAASLAAQTAREAVARAEEAEEAHGAARRSGCSEERLAELADAAAKLRTEADKKVAEADATFAKLATEVRTTAASVAAAGFEPSSRSEVLSLGADLLTAAELGFMTESISAANALTSHGIRLSSDSKGVNASFSMLFRGECPIDRVESLRRVQSLQSLVSPAAASKTGSSPAASSAAPAASPASADAVDRSSGRQRAAPPTLPPAVARRLGVRVGVAGGGERPSTPTLVLASSMSSMDRLARLAAREGLELPDFAYEDATVWDQPEAERALSSSAPARDAPLREADAPGGGESVTSHLRHVAGAADYEEEGGEADEDGAEASGAGGSAKPATPNASPADFMELSVSPDGSAFSVDGLCAGNTLLRFNVFGAANAQAAETLDVQAKLDTPPQDIGQVADALADAVSFGDTSISEDAAFAVRGEHHGEEAKADAAKRVRNGGLGAGRGTHAPAERGGFAADDDEFDLEHVPEQRMTGVGAAAVTAPLPRSTSTVDSSAGMSSGGRHRAASDEGIESGPVRLADRSLRSRWSLPSRKAHAAPPGPLEGDTRSSAAKWHSRNNEIWAGRAVCTVSSVLEAAHAQRFLPLRDEEGNIVGWLRLRLAALNRGKPAKSGKRINRWYGFRADAGAARLLVEEHVRESAYAFDVPAKMLRLILEERRANLRVAEQDLRRYSESSSVPRPIGQPPKSSPEGGRRLTSVGESDSTDVLASSVDSVGSFLAEGARSPPKKSMMKRAAPKRLLVPPTSVAKGSPGAAQPRGSLFGELVGQLRHAEDLRQARTFLQQRVVRLREYVEMLDRARQVGLGGRTDDGHTFKPSTLKASDALRFVATNMHVQEMHVQQLQGGEVVPVSLSGREAIWGDGAFPAVHPHDDRSDGVYDTVTVGAFAAHAYGFKKGGIRQQLELLKQQQEARRSGGSATPVPTAPGRSSQRSRKHKAKLQRRFSSLSANAALREEENLVWDIQFRHDVVLCQAASALVTAFSRRLRILQRYMLPRDGTRVLEQWMRAGFLCAVESLLSTAGKELGMLGDFEMGVKMLHKFAFRLLPPLPHVDDATAAAAGATSPTAGATIGGSAAAAGAGGAVDDLNLSERRLHAHMLGLLESRSHWGGLMKLRVEHVLFNEGTRERVFVVEMRMWPPTQGDSAEDRSDAGTPLPSVSTGSDAERSAAAAAAQRLRHPSVSRLHSRSTSGGEPVTPTTKAGMAIDVFPEELRRLVPSQLRHGRLIHVVPVLFTQGVNEMQTVANLSGNAALQDEINERNLHVLRRYVDRYHQWLLRRARGDFGRESALDTMDMLGRERLAEMLERDDRAGQASARAHGSSAPLPGAPRAAGARSGGGGAGGAGRGGGPRAAFSGMGGAGSAPHGSSSSHLAHLPEVGGEDGADDEESGAESGGDDAVDEVQRGFSVPWPAPAALSGALNRIAAVLRADRGRKSVETLRMTSDVCRMLHGARITSCKSAKDRTSMSITLEQARILHAQHGLAADDVAWVTELMRRHGVRRANAEKNVGRARYAFNSFQNFLLPAEFQAPDGTTGKTIQS